jgi:[ribosomal protein S5]-alanine N-acetyltransferase
MGPGIYHQPMTPTLETPHLLLCPLSLEDAYQVQMLFPNWNIVQYLNSRIPWPYPSNGVETFYREVALSAIERGEEWHWTLRPKDAPDQIIGAIALMTNGDDNRGFWLAQAWHGHGLMTEACNTVTDYWFNTLQFPVLRAWKAITNAASRRISEKQGMRVIAREERDYVCGRLPAECWEITAEEWRAREPLRTDD